MTNNTSAAWGRVVASRKFVWLAGFLFMRSYYYLRVVVAPVMGWR